MGKIVLEKGSSTKLSLAKNNELDSVAVALFQNRPDAFINIKMNWTKAVDLDLHAFYKTKSGEFGQVFYSNKGTLIHPPFIQLDQDAGVGNVGGNNEENLYIGNLDIFESIIIATNIFRVLGFLSKGENFAKYDGRVTLRSIKGDYIEVPLTSQERGRWCLIAKIDNRSGEPHIINLNQVQKKAPTRMDL